MTEFPKYKEKDLELAAKIGKSLLEQNKELRDRNDFLEECLNVSNETVTQLKHQLQQRSDLLNTVCSLGDDYYQQEEAARNDQVVEKLQKRVRQLEDETSNLRLETSSLKEFICEVESQSQEKIEQYLKQLESANLKIHKLHSQITDKNAECSLQATEIQKLVRDINHRKSSEKMLKEATSDLSTQLHAAITAHDQLKSEILNLQEVYSDVRERLHEAEEELGNYRIKSAPHRIGEIILDEYEIPSKALIDSVRSNRRLREKSPSLADELMPSGATATEGSLIAPPKLEAITEIQTPLIEQQELPGSLLAIKDQTPSSPSKAGLKSSVSSDSDPEDPELRFVEDCCRNPSTSSTTSPSLPLPAPITQKTYRDSSCSPIPALIIDWQTPISISSKSTPSGASSPQSSTTKPCGIATPSPRPPKQSTTSSSMDYDEEITPRAMNQQQPTASESHQSSSNSNSAEDMIEPPTTLSKAESNDSLNKYTGPKLGEPGKPGTRDLEFSLRKLKLRKQCPKCSSVLINVVGFETQKPIDIGKIERDYQRFRESRGLPPSIHGFFTNLTIEQQPPKPKKLCGPLGSQFEYLSSTPDDSKPSPIRPFIFTRNFPPVPKTAFGAAKTSTWQKQSGLTAAVPAISPSTEGIIQRAEVISPEQSKSSETTPKKFSQTTKSHNRSSLLSALGLNTLIDSDPESPTKNPESSTKSSSIFRSPFLFGPSYQIDREFSPPFYGASIPAIGDSLEFLHHPSSPPSQESPTTNPSTAI
uniref:HAP1 N-terminal domain-containing protein n=1 Tax=Panagrolaimus sp. PS1159 TaxID=55785 RepID=A0AC35FW27_9BILA